MSVEVEIKGSREVNQMFAKMRGVWPEYEKVVKRGTLELEALIKKEYLTVKDGNALPGQVAGNRRLPRRRKKPGLRAVSRNLLRNTRSAFRRRFGVLEGAVGTNVDYGVIQERKGTYAFLEPGLKKYFPKFKTMLSRTLKARLKK